MARAGTPSFTLTLKLDATEDDLAEASRRFRAAERLQNALADHANKAIRQVRRNGRHKSALRRRRALAKAYEPYRRRLSVLKARIGALESKAGPELTAKEREDLRAARSERARLSKESGPVKDALGAVDAELAHVREAFGLTERALELYATEGKRRQGLERLLSANECQKVAARVWQAAEKCLFEGSDRVSFLRGGDLRSVEGKSNRQGVRLLKGDAGLWEVAWSTQWRDPATGRLRTSTLRCPAIVRDGDLLAQEALRSHRVKYCRLLRKWVNGRQNLYVQPVFEGVPPDVKHREVSGLRGGVDRGTSTIAVVNEAGDCLLAETTGTCSERVQASVERQAGILRKMDRSRRATNPANFNPDGTCKTGPKRWLRSKAYMRLLGDLRSERRHCAALRKQACEALANDVLALCSDLVWEPMDFRALAKRARRSGKRDGRTGRERSRRRYGGSVHAHTPAQFSACIERKLRYLGRSVREVDIGAYRASQLDHVTGELRKPALSERWKEVGGHRVQRDLYSAFLLCHPNRDLTAPDPALCSGAFPSFLAGHDRCVSSMVGQGLSCPGSFGF